MDSAPQFTETASSPTLLTDGVKRRLFSVAGPSSVPPSTPLLPVTVSPSSLYTNTFHSSSAKKHVPAPSNIPLSTPILPVTVGRRSLFTDAFHSSSANKHDVVPASIPPSTPILSVMINRRSQSSSNPGRQSSNPGSQSRSTSTIPPTTSFQLPPPHSRRNPDAKNASSAINKEKGNVFIILCFIYHFQLNRTGWNFGQCNSVFSSPKHWKTIFFKLFFFFFITKQKFGKYKVVTNVTSLNSFLKLLGKGIDSKGRGKTVMEHSYGTTMPPPTSRSRTFMDNWISGGNSDPPFGPNVVNWLKFIDNIYASFLIKTISTSDAN